MAAHEEVGAGIGKRTAAEAIGTFWLVFAGCGTAVISAFVWPGGVGLLGVALAFGLALLTMAYALGRISGAHFNPAVTVALACARRFPGRDVLPYVAAQFAGAIMAAAVLYLIARGQPSFTLERGFASNGYGDHSPAGYPMMSAFAMEAVLTAGFVLVILGATHERAPVHFAPIAIGLALTLVNLVGIPVTNVSVNPARSTGTALVEGSWALDQLWLFWVAPLLAGAIAGGVYALVTTTARRAPAVTGDVEQRV